MTDNKQALFDAVFQRNYRAAESLLSDDQVNPNFTIGNGFPLMEATSSGAQGIVRLLLRHGADPVLRTNATAANAAIRHGYISILKDLVLSSQDPNQPDEDGATLLHYTVYSLLNENSAKSLSILYWLFCYPNIQPLENTTAEYIKGTPAEYLVTKYIDAERLLGKNSKKYLQQQCINGLKAFLISRPEFFPLLDNSNIKEEEESALYKSLFGITDSRTQAKIKAIIQPIVEYIHATRKRYTLPLLCTMQYLRLYATSEQRKELLVFDNPNYHKDIDNPQNANNTNDPTKIANNILTELKKSLLRIVYIFQNLKQGDITDDISKNLMVLPLEIRTQIFEYMLITLNTPTTDHIIEETSTEETVPSLSMARLTL